MNMVCTQMLARVKFEVFLFSRPCCPPCCRCCAVLSTQINTLYLNNARYMDEHGIDVHCLVPLPWLECEPGLHADEAKALEVNRIQSFCVTSDPFNTRWNFGL